MAYQVTARKWRPQNFDEVVFQDHVSKTLKNSIIKGRISHAYLFSGPRGVGKTTMARILAKALNCIEGPTPTPCGKCDNCREIRDGNSFDVIEIDGASNRGIEDIRELRENVNFAPIKARYKIYIIDEVHMLTQPAFNALLKTLEEPPPHIVFIFATTEVHQIPETILSRCQKYFFKKIPIGPLVDHLKVIVSHEGYRISDTALYPIARAAGGSMRDAQSLLDQVISFSDHGLEGDSREGEISEEDALSILGIVPVESYAKLLHCIIDCNIMAAMEEVNRVVVLGVDIPRYVAGFADVLRTLRLLLNRVSVNELLGLSKDEIGILKDISGKFYDEELGVIFRIVIELQGDLKYSNNERVHLEMALLDMISVKKSPSLASIVGRLEGLNIEQGKGALKTEGADDAVAGPGSRESAPVPPQGEPGEQISDDRIITKHWQDFLSRIKDDKQYLHFILKPSKIELKDNTLHIQYPDGTDHAYYRRILDSKNLSIIKGEMSGLLGRKIQVVVGVSGETGVQKMDKKDLHKKGAEKKMQVPPPDDAIPVPDAEMLKNPGAEEFEQANPTIEKIKNIFHGEIIDKGED